MLSQEERLSRMHARACEIRDIRDRKINTALRTASVLLFVSLITVISSLSGFHMSVSPGDNTGSSLLDSSAGGYVLVAVLSFAAAVVITVLCIRSRSKKSESNADINNDDTAVQDSSISNRTEL